MDASSWSIIKVIPLRVNRRVYRLRAATKRHRFRLGLLGAEPKCSESKTVVSDQVTSRLVVAFHKDWTIKKRWSF